MVPPCPSSASVLQKSPAEERAPAERDAEAVDGERERDDEGRQKVPRVPRRELGRDRVKDVQVEEEGRRDERQQPVAVQDPDAHEGGQGGERHSGGLLRQAQGQRRERPEAERGETLAAQEDVEQEQEKEQDERLKEGGVDLERQAVGERAEPEQP